MPKEKNPNAGMFFTDPQLADRWVRSIMRKSGGLKGLSVLEPSAGDGALFKAALDAGAKHVTAIEILPRFAKGLAATMPSKGTALQGNFLSWKPLQDFDVVLMNPPYEDGQDVDHIAKAIECAPFVSALVRANVPLLHSFYKKVLCEGARIDRVVNLVGRCAKFYGPGDKGETPRHDYVIIDVVKHDGVCVPPMFDCFVRTEWWTRSSIYTG